MVLMAGSLGRPKTSCSLILDDFAKNYRAPRGGSRRTELLRARQVDDLLVGEPSKPLATRLHRNYAPCAPSHDNLPTWIAESELKSPNTFSSHKTTPMTTTPFRIDLIDPAIGI